LPHGAADAQGGAVRIGILGGTFNPLHLGHLSLAEAASGAHRLDRVLLVPAREPPHKPGLELAAAGDRMEIVERGVRGRSGLEACSVELDRPGPSYTVDTLEELGRRYPGAELMLLVGADAFADMGSWRDVSRIFDLARVIVVDRACPPLPRVPRLPGLSQDVITRCQRDRVAMEPVAVSSTGVRERIAAGRSISGLVPDSVAAYIEERGLYRGAC